MTRVYRITALVLAVVAVGVGAFFAGRSTAPTTTSGPTTTTSEAPTTSTSPAVCEAAQLRIAQSGVNGAAGTIERTFSLVNAGPAPCTLDGYPGLLLLGHGPAVQPTNVVRGGGLTFENIPPSAVELAPGATAYFNIGYSDVTAPCSTATAVAVIPPATSTHLAVSVAPSILACDNGTLHVSAVFGSTDRTATQTTAPPST